MVLSSLVSILEGPEVTTQKSWSLSFYIGPKESGALSAVDSRLEKTLGYSGILSPYIKSSPCAINFLVSIYT